MADSKKKASAVDSAAAEEAAATNEEEEEAATATVTVPTEESTVEEVLHYYFVHRANAELQRLKKELMEKMKEKTEAEIQKIRELYEEKENELLNGCDDSATISTAPSAAAATTRRGRPPTTTAPTALGIRVVEGPHKGEEFRLKPSVRRVCLVGRSRAAAYTKHGVALGSDREVSTKHGQFGWDPDANQVYFEDLGSTNHSFVRNPGEPEETLKGGEQAWVKHQCIITVGVSKMRVEFE